MHAGMTDMHIMHVRTGGTLLYVSRLFLCDKETGEQTGSYG